MLEIADTMLPAKTFESASRAIETGDYAVALDIYEHLAKSGQPYSLVLLANMHAEGKGTSANIDRAEELLDQAALLGVTEALLQKASIWQRRGDMPRYFKAIQRAARAGLLPAQYQLGICYSKGIGTPANVEEAARTMHEAANRGHVGAKMYVAQRLIAHPSDPIGLIRGLCLLLFATIESLIIGTRNPDDDRFR